MGLFNLKKLGNQQGFTLPEIMIGVAIIAGVALAGATIFKNQAKSQARVDHDQILTQYHHVLSRILETPANCNATFKSFATAGAVPISTAALPGVFICTGNCELEFPASMVSFDAANPFAAPNAFIDKAASREIWKIVSLAPAVAVQTTGPVRVRVTYNNTKMDNRTVVKDINVNVRFNAGKFIQCFNNQQSAVNNLQNDLCKSLYNQSSLGVASAGSGQIAVFDPSTQKCVLNTSVKDCTTQGSMLGGIISSDGAVRCKNFVDSFDTLFNSSSPTANCAGALKASVQYDSATGKLKVVCAP
jgi:prepilin-type N-terminal cleavage/methylation domain-containing protein